MCRTRAHRTQQSIYFFLKRGGKIFATVTGNKFFNIGLELLCTYTFSGQAADVENLRTLLKPTAT